MTNVFVPKFYPKTITPTTYHYILASIDIIYSCSEFYKYDYRTHKFTSSIDWHYKIYKNFDFDAYKPFFKKQQFYRNQKKNEYNKKLSFDFFFKKILFKIREKFAYKISKKEQKKFENACIDNFKNVDVKEYYEFLKFIISYKTENKLVNSGILYKIWKECDIAVFLNELLEIDISLFYNEMKRIKDDYIEYLI